MIQVLLEQEHCWCNYVHSIQTNALCFQALSGVGETILDRAKITGNTALSAALNTQFLFQIGIFTAVPMILGFILEQGFLRVSVFVHFINLIAITEEIQSV